MINNFCSCVHATLPIDSTTSALLKASRQAFLPFALVIEKINKVEVAPVCTVKEKTRQSKIVDLYGPRLTLYGQIN